MPTATATGSSRSSTSCTPTGSSSRSSTTARASSRPPARARALADDELSEGGLGIAIIEALADELEIGEGDARRLAAPLRQAPRVDDRGRPPVADRRLEPRAGHLRPRRGRRARRAARRRRARHGAARAARAPRRDVDRERDDRRGPRRRGRGRRASVALVAHDPPRTTRYYNVVANPMLWFIQHWLWGRAFRPDLDRGVPRCVARLRDGEPRCSRTRSLPNWTTNPDAAVLFQDYHLYLAPALRARRAARRAARALRPHPVAGRLDDRCRSRCGAPCTTACSRTTSSAFHTERWARNFERELRGDRRRLRTHARHASRDLDRHRRSSTSCAQRRPCSREEAQIARRGPRSSIVRVDRTDPSKNIVRGFEAFGAPARRASGVARPRHAARTARSVAAGDPGVRRVPRCDRADGRRGERALRHPAGADRPAASPTTSRGRSPRTSSSTCCS